MKVIIGALLIFSIIALLANIFNKKNTDRKSAIKFYAIAIIVLIFFNGIVNSCSSKKTENNNNSAPVKESNEESKKDNNTETKEEIKEDKKESYDGISNIKEEKVMNGTGDTQIGKCGTAVFDKDKITEESLVKFYNEKIKDSGYNYYTLINKNDKSKGMVFSGCLPGFTYGIIDETYAITNGIGDGRVENDKAEYEKR